MMKTASLTKSRSPSKRLRSRPSSGRGSELRPPSAPRTLAGFIRSVRRALRRRPDDYLEFAALVMTLHRPPPPRKNGLVEDTEEAQSDGETDRIGLIERLVTLLDGHPGLIAGLATFLPPQFALDIQPDAVVVKVFETDGGDNSLVDTGHGRRVEDLGTSVGGLATNGYDCSPGSTAILGRRERQRTPHGRPWSAAAASRSLSCPPREILQASNGRRPGPETITMSRRPRTASCGGSVERRSGPKSGKYVSVFDLFSAPTDARYPVVEQRQSICSKDALSARPKSASPKSVSFDDASLVEQRPRQSAVDTSTTSLLRSSQRPRTATASYRNAAPQGGRRRRPASAVVTNNGAGSYGSTGVEVGDTVAYVLEVKRALGKRPDDYRQFVDVLRRCNEQQRRSTDGDVQSAIRDVVSLLRTRPQLVLGFNEFVPRGYRVKVFDSSTYIIESPDGVGGTTRTRVDI